MAIIDKILKRDPQEQLRRRLSELPALNQKELQAIVANDDEEADVRNEAVLLLEFGEPLIQSAFQQNQSALTRNARQRLADLIDNDAVSVAQASQMLDLSQRLTVSGLVNNDDKVEQLLAAISDQQQLLDLASEHDSARIRQWAAEKITDPHGQQTLLKTSKGKDKNVYKLMKSRLDEQQAQERQRQEQKNKIADLIDAIAKHSEGLVDNLYQAKYDLLKQQWRAVQSDADSAAQAKVAGFFAQCEHLLAESQAAPPEPESQPAAEKVDHERINQQRAELLDGLKKVIRVLLEDPDGLDKSHTELNCINIESRWQDLNKHAQPESQALVQYQNLAKVVEYELSDIDVHGSLQKHFERLLDSALDTDSHSLALQEKSLKRFKRRLQTAKDVEFNPDQVATYEQEFAQWQQQRQERLEQQQALIKQIGALIRKSHGALKSGKTGAAQGMRATVQEKSERVEKLPRHLQKQLEGLDETLSKVQDWKEYAVLPKKRELVQQMQALIGVDEPPDALATKIKRLQDEWKLLSRGGFNDDGELWEQFRQAGDQAFEPCASYFAEQAEVRKSNLQKRQQLVQQLRDYDANQNWEHPDWRQVAKLLQVAFKEWRGYQPVERAANKSVQKDFDAIIGSIREKLNQEHQRNKDQKKALIEEAAKLVEMEDNRTATEQAKHLQSRWKLIGSASHKADQALWKQFRKQCDQVFDKRKQINAEFKAELNDNKHKVLALCEELQTLSQQKLDGLLASRERADAIREEFKAIGSLPKEKVKDLQKRFRGALDNFEQSIRQQQAKAKAGAWDDLLEAYQGARNYCLAPVKGGDSEQEKAALDQVMEQQSQWPKGGKDALQQCLDNAHHSPDPAERRLLCVRMEILADLESPQDDHDLRMNYQVKQLAKGFGQAQQQTANAKEALQSLLLEWVALPPVAGENYEQLLARINRCREKIGV